MGRGSGYRDGARGVRGTGPAAPRSLRGRNVTTGVTAQALRATPSSIKRTDG